MCDHDDLNTMSWIENSELFKTMKEDYPDDVPFEGDKRLFEFPKTICKDNIRSILENIRFFGITDEMVFYKVFKYLYESEDNVIYDFPEFKSLKYYCDVDTIYKRYGNSYRRKLDCSIIASNGDLWTLKYAYESGCYIDYHTTKAAALNGHLHCLKWLHSKKCKWSQGTCNMAAINGHLECLKYAVENGCKIDKHTMRYASECGNLECLKFLYENKCPSDDWTFRTSHVASLKFLHLKYNIIPYDVIYYYIIDGSIECLKYAIENTSYNRSFYCYAARGNIESLKYLHSIGCPWGENFLNFLIEEGNIECLKYAVENGCPVPEKINVMSYKMQNKHIFNVDNTDKKYVHILDYMYSKGCTIEENTCDFAFEYNFFRILKFALKHGCKLNVNVNEIIDKGNLEILKYAHKHGYEMIGKIRPRTILNSNMKECLDYVLDNKIAEYPYVHNTIFNSTSLKSKNNEHLIDFTEYIKINNLQTIQK